MTAARRRPAAFVLPIASQPATRAAIATLTTLSGMAALAAWVAHWPPAAWLAIGLPALAWAAWRQAEPAALTLQFDGADWWLAAPGREPVACRVVEVVFDFDDWLLLRVRAPRWRYLPLARSRVGAEWGRLRATLYAARPEAGRDAR